MICDQGVRQLPVYFMIVQWDCIDEEQVILAQKQFLRMILSWRILALRYRSKRDAAEEWFNSGAARPICECLGLDVGAIYCEVERILDEPFWPSSKRPPRSVAHR